MSYRYLENIDEKIIDATIVVGSENWANKLSTKEIAKACGVSEFVIYGHFKTKENLVSEADKKVIREINLFALALTDKATTIDKFWNGIVDYFINYKAYTAFVLNYGHVFPKPVKPEDNEAFIHENISSQAETILNKYGIVRKELSGYAYLWMLILRSAVSYAQFVISGTIIDGPEFREENGSVIVLGLVDLQKK